MSTVAGVAGARQVQGPAWTATQMVRSILRAAELTQIWIGVGSMTSAL